MRVSRRRRSPDDPRPQPTTLCSTRYIDSSLLHIRRPPSRNNVTITTKLSLLDVIDCGHGCLKPRFDAIAWGWGLRALHWCFAAAAN